MRLLKEEETPVNWNSNRIGYYVEKHKGGAPLKPADFSSSGFPVIPKKAVKSGNRLLITNPTYCTIEFAKSNTRSIVDSSYTITTLRDLVPTGPTIGTVVNYTSDEEYVLSQGVYGLKLINSLDRVYFAYLSNSSHYRKVMRRLMVGSTQVHIRTPEYLNLEIQVPPLAEQKKIAQILSTWDKSITATEQLLANSQQQKKALMQQLLTGKKRLLDENGVRFSGEWLSLQLGDFSEITTGKSKSKYVTKEGQNFILDMGSVNRQGKLVPSKRTNLDSDYLQVGQLVMPKDDIGGGNILGRVGYITENNKFILGDHVYALKISGHDSLFISYLINGHTVNKSLRRKANGTAQLGLGKKDVLKQLIYLPPSRSEQQHIASALFAADQEISKLQFKISSLKNEKKALMQQLLTGKRRVKVDKKAA